MTLSQPGTTFRKQCQMMMMFRGLLTIVVLLFVSVLLASCTGTGSVQGPPPANSPAPVQPTQQRSPQTQFESDLQYVRNGLYTYVWVFSRKDGKPIDKEDAAFLRKNAPQVVDWITTEQGKKVIGGTNFDLEQGNLDLLKKRFIVEDYSAK